MKMFLKKNLSTNVPGDTTGYGPIWALSFFPFLRFFFLFFFLSFFRSFLFSLDPPEFKESKGIPELNEERL